MKVPQAIRDIERPKNTVVISYGKNNDLYAVRERSGCIYDNGRRMPVNGKIIGHIIDGKYVPIGVRPEPIPVSQSPVDLKDWAGIEFCNSLSCGLLDELLNIYCRDDALKIYCIALLRVCNPGIKDYELNDAYHESFVSEIYPGVPLSKNTVSDFWNDLGKAYSRIVEYMRLRVKAVEGHRKLIDGTLKSNESTVNSLSDYSRKARTKGTRDISILYCFDLDTMEPVSSKCFPGNMLDSVSYSDFLEEYQITSGLIVGDKGFPSSCAKKIFDGKNGLHFMNPLKRDSKYIKLNNLLAYDGQLPGHETVLYKKVYLEKEQKWLYSFKDTSQAHKEDYGWLHKVQTRDHGYDDNKYKEDSQLFGTIVLECDLDLEPLTAYLTYDARWEIELVMRYYKQACEFDETRVHDDYSVIGSEFCSFLSSVMTYKMLNKVEKTGILQTMTYKKFMSIMKKAKKVRLSENGEWKLIKILPSHMEVLQQVELLPKPAKQKRGRKPKSKV